jgi:hypothetical protein
VIDNIKNIDYGGGAEGVTSNVAERCESIFNLLCV